MKALAWALGTLAALGMIAVFCGAFAMAGAAHGAAERGRAQAELTRRLMEVEEEHREHMAMDSAREEAVRRMVDPRTAGS